MKNNKKLVVISVVAFVLIFFGATKAYKSYEARRLGFLAKDNAELFVRKHSPTFGEADSKIYLIEFLDPECESCRSFYPKIKRLMKEYKGKVKLVVRYAPFHHNSKFAIQILEASRKQGKYWETLELLFNYQSEWGSHHNPRPELIWDYLPEVGLNIEQIKNDMNDPKINELIQQDIEDGKKLGVRRTPTFFVNGSPIEKFGLAYIKNAIELVN